MSIPQTDKQTSGYDAAACRACSRLDGGHLHPVAAPGVAGPRLQPGLLHHVDRDRPHLGQHRRSAPDAVSRASSCTVASFSNILVSTSHNRRHDYTRSHRGSYCGAPAITDIAGAMRMLRMNVLPLLSGAPTLSLHNRRALPLTGCMCHAAVTVVFFPLLESHDLILNVFTLGAYGRWQAVRSLKEQRLCRT